MKNYQWTGALAAMMVLAPAGMQILANGEDSPVIPDETSVAAASDQATAAWTDPVLPDDSGENGTETDQTAYSADEDSSIYRQDTADESIRENAPAAALEDADKNNEPDDDLKQAAQPAAEAEDRKEETAFESVSDQPIIKAEDEIIPDSVDENSTLIIPEYTSMNINESPVELETSLKEYFSAPQTLRIQELGAKDAARYVDMAFTWEDLDLSSLASPYRNYHNFYGVIKVDCSAAVKKHNELYSTFFTGDYANLVECVFDQAAGKWVLFNYPGLHRTEDDKLDSRLWILRMQNPSEGIPAQNEEQPAGRDLEPEVIKTGFLNEISQIQVTVDGKTPITIPLLRDGMTVGTYQNTKNIAYVSINLNSLLKGQIPEGSRVMLSSIRQEDFAGSEFASGSHTETATYNDSLSYRMIWSKENGWQLFNPVADIPSIKISTLKHDSSTETVVNQIANYVEGLTVHLKNAKTGEVAEYNWIPGSTSFTDSFRQVTYTDPTYPSGAEHILYYDIFSQPYLKEHELRTGKRWKLADCELTQGFGEAAARIGEDGIWRFQNPYLPESHYARHEVLFFIEEAEPLTIPLFTYAGTFEGDDWVVQAHTGQGLDGLTMVVEPVQPSEVTVPDDVKEYAVYDIHFENKGGREICRYGTFTVTLTLPDSMAGKKLQVYHLGANGLELLQLYTDGHTVRFQTSEFSQFVVAVHPDSSIEQPEQKDPDPVKPTPSTPDTPSLVEQITAPAEDDRKEPVKIINLNVKQPLRVSAAESGNALMTGDAAARKTATEAESPQTAAAAGISSLSALMGAAGLGAFVSGRKRRHAH